MKKRICLFISVALCLSLISGVFAENTEYDNEITEKSWEELSLSSKSAFELGIIERDYSDNLDLSTRVTRADFAQMLYKVASNMQDAQNSQYSDVIFSDVERYHFAFNEISYLSGLGVISGYEDGTFRPEQQITGNEAITLLLNLAGYKSVIKSTEYVSAANSFGLLKNISINLSGSITRENASELFGNFLYVKTAVLDGSGVIADGEIVLKEFMDLDSIDGVIEAASGVSLFAKEFGENRIQIKGNSYYTSDGEDFSEYTGYNARVFVDRDDKVKAVIPNRNKTLCIESKNINKYTDNIYYYNKNDKEKTAKIDKSKDTLLNGYYSSDTSQMIPECGMIILIDNDLDNDYDVVKIESYKTYVVDKVISAEHTIVMKNTDSAGKQIFCDLQNWRDYKILDKNNCELDIAEIKENDVVSIAPSGTEKVTVYVSTDSVEGKATEVDEDLIAIDGEEYYLIKNAYLNDWDGLSGATITFLLDKLGNIAGVASLKAGEWRYAVIIKCKINNRNENLSIKVLDQDGEIKTFETDDKLKIDGQAFSNTGASYNYMDDCYSQFAETKPGQTIATDNDYVIYDRMSTRLMRYYLSNDNKIKKIDTPVFKSKFETQSTSNNDLADCLVISSKGRLHYTNTFSYMLRVPYAGYSEVDGEVVVGATTKVFVIPKELNDLNDSSAMGVYSSLKSAGCVDNKYYAASGYALKTGSIYDDVVVIAKSAGESTTGMDVGVFMKQKCMLNADGESANFVEGVFDGEVASYELSEKNKYNIQSLNKGDVVLYSLNNGKIVIDSLGFRASNETGSLVDEPRLITMSGDGHYFAKGRIILGQLVKYTDGVGIIKYYNDKYTEEIMPNLKKSYMYSEKTSEESLSMVSVESLKTYDTFRESADYIIINQRDGEIKDQYIIRK